MSTDLELGYISKITIPAIGHMQVSAGSRDLWRIYFIGCPVILGFLEPATIRALEERGHMVQDEGRTWSNATAIAIWANPRGTPFLNLQRGRCAPSASKIPIRQEDLPNRLPSAPLGRKASSWQGKKPISTCATS